MTIHHPIILAAIVVAIFLSAWATAEPDAAAQDVVAELVAEAESGAWASIDAMQISTTSRQ